MKKISEHLGQIIIALAGVALLIAACVVFKEPIGDFYNSIVGKEVSVAGDVLAGVEDPNLSDLSSGGSGSVVMLEGDGQEVNKFAFTPMRFRSSAPVGELTEVKINGETVDPSNYDVTEGSTVITFKNEYVKSLNLGAGAIDIVSESGTASGGYTVINVIPEGATYTAADGTVYEAGDKFPGTAQDGDIYVYGDYQYCYGYTWCQYANVWGHLSPAAGGYKKIDHWAVHVNENSKSSYGPILTNINGFDIIDLQRAFANCTSLTDLSGLVIPNNVTSLDSTFYNCRSLNDISNLVIPSSVTSLSNTFYQCASLKDVSGLVIPSSVTNMNHTFHGCNSLTTAPTIPSSVTDMGFTFYNCGSLTGTLVINTNLKTYNGCFEATTQPIILCTNKSITTLLNLLGTSNNGNLTIATAAYVTADGTTYFDNDVLPEVQVGDVLYCGDYKYTYSSSGWRVAVLDKNKSAYGEILAEINGAAVTNMYQTFMSCTSLTTAPTIPSSVTNVDWAFLNCTSLTTAPDMSNASSITNMSSTFQGCTSLTTAPAIPSGVSDMSSTFLNCTSLTDVSDLVIPSSVTDMTSTFSGCTSLYGVIEINANPTSWTKALYNTQITEIVGSTTKAEHIMLTKTSTESNPKPSSGNAGMIPG